MDKYFYSLQLDNNEKVIHMSGNVYYNDADETENCYRIAEWTHLCIGVEDAKQMISEDEFFDFINERVNYLDNKTETEAKEMCKNYFNGNPGIELHILDITENTPCGDYWFE